MEGKMTGSVPLQDADSTQGVPKNGLRAAGGGPEAKTTTVPEISWIYWFNISTLVQFVQLIRFKLHQLHRDVHKMTVSLTSKGREKNVPYVKGVQGNGCVRELNRVKKFLENEWRDELDYRQKLLKKIVADRTKVDSCQEDLDGLEKEHRRRCNILVYMRDIIKSTKIDEESLSIWNPAGFKPEEVFGCIFADTSYAPTDQEKTDIGHLLNISPEDITAFEDKLLDLCQEYEIITE